MKKFYKEPTISVFGFEKADVMILSFEADGEGTKIFDASSDLIWR